MTRDEAIERLNGIINAMSISIAQSKFFPSKAELNELCDTAIEALYHHTEKTDNISTKVKSDLISRADAIERLKYHTDFIKDRNYADGEELLYKESAIAQINALPTADAVSREDFTKAIKAGLKLQAELNADRPSIVRCKDCRHRDLFSCPLADQKDEDFCSWGERKEP